MKQGTKKQATRKSLHPLDMLLQHSSDDSRSMLGTLAQGIVGLARDKEPGWFIEVSRNKIQLLKYRPPDSKKDRQTFSEILKRADVLKTFLSPLVQGEIEKWLLLSDIFKEHRKNKEEGKSVEGFPIQFHKDMRRELLRHFETIRRVARKHNSRRAIADYYTSVRREIVRQATPLIFNSRLPIWASLLGESKRDFSPRDEEAAIRARVFFVLRTKLQSARSKKLGISDQFLRQLAELLMSRASSGHLPTGDRIRYAVNSRTSPGNWSTKSEGK